RSIVSAAGQGCQFCRFSLGSKASRQAAGRAGVRKVDHARPPRTRRCGRSRQHRADRACAELLRAIPVGLAVPRPVGETGAAAPNLAGLPAIPISVPISAAAAGRGRAAAILLSGASRIARAGGRAGAAASAARSRVRALYLWQDNKDTLYRIHGTNEPWTIGRSVSSGCIRMLNQDVMDLYERAPVGAKVVVLGSRGASS